MEMIYCVIAIFFHPARERGDRGDRLKRLAKAKRREIPATGSRPT
jgi:hypothetical protein